MEKRRAEFSGNDSDYSIGIENEGESEEDNVVAGSLES